MRRRSRAVWATGAAVLALLGAAPAGAVSPEERRASCDAIANSLPNTGAEGPAGRFVSAGAASSRLPRRVHLDGGTQAISTTYDYALLDGDLYSRTRKRGARPAGDWVRVVVPPCIAGHLESISNDGDLLLAVDREGRVWWTTASDKGPGALRWSRRWGPILWTGDGVVLPSDTIAWSTSSTSSKFRFVDGSGTLRSTAGAGTLYELRRGGQRITYDDPWLPSDGSYEVCGPDQGAFRAVGIASGAATVMVIGEHAEIYTKTYDFDLSGANTLLLQYTYADQRGAAGNTMQLPRPGWRKQPTIDRVLTSAITVLVTGTHESQRLLRVEGINRAGRRGVWQKQVDAPRWRWVGTDAPLRGRRLSDERTPAPRGTPETYRFLATVDGVRIEVPTFSVACSPVPLQMTADGTTIELRLHLVDAIRQAVRGPGLGVAPRNFLGQIEVPTDVRARHGSLPPSLRAILDGPLGGGTFTEAPVAATDRVLRLGNQCWNLTPDGGAPSPRLLEELLAQVLELGTVVNLVTGQPDHRAPLPVALC